MFNVVWNYNWISLTYSIIYFIYLFIYWNVIPIWIYMYVCGRHWIWVYITKPTSTINKINYIYCGMCDKYSRSWEHLILKMSMVNTSMSTVSDSLFSDFWFQNGKSRLWFILFDYSRNVKTKQQKTICRSVKMTSTAAVAVELFMDQK